MQPKKQFKPQDLRTLLAVLLILVLAGGAAGYYFGIGVIRDYAIKVNHRLADADASGKQIEELQLLKQQLAQSNSLVSKANALFSAPATYQSQVLTDLKSYVDAAGLTMTNTNFEDATQTGSYSITINLQQPVSYNGLIAFLHNVEGNIPKLQVRSIALSPSSDGVNTVRTGDIKIDVLVR